MSFTVALLVLIVVVGIVFAVFTVDPGMKKLAYIVLGVVVVVWALSAFGLLNGLGFRLP